MRNFLINIVWLALFLICTVPAQDDWQPAYGPYGGVVRDMIQIDNGDIYAAAGTGVLKSMDNGRNWVLLSSGLEGLDVKDMAYNSRAIFMATPEQGIYKSYDGGDSWSRADSGQFDPWLVNVISANSSGDLFVGTGTYTGRIFRSTDDGLTWEELVVIPGANNPIVTFIETAHSLIYIGTHGSGIWRSEDKGDSWHPISNEVTGQYSWAAMVMPDGGLYAGAVNNVFYSADSGASWSDVSNGIIGGSYISALAADSSGTLFAGSTNHGMYRSFDGGQHWEQAHSGMIVQRVNTMLVSNSDELYAANDPYIFRTGDRAATWQLANRGLPGYPVNDLLNADGRMYAATPNGIAYTTDKGRTWALSSDGLPEDNILAVSSHNGYLFAGTQRNGIYRSSNGGQDWQQANEGLVNNYVLDFASDESNNVLYAACGNTIHRSFDDGQTWEYVANVAGILPGLVTEISVNKINGYAYAVYTVWPNTRRVIYSIDHGEAGTWQLAYNDGLPYLSLAIDRQGGIWVGGQGGVVYSPDGVNWSKKYIGHDVQEILVSNQGDVYAGTSTGGVFWKKQADSAYTALVTGLEDLNITALAYDVDGYLYAGTGSRGVFRSNMIITDLEIRRRLFPERLALMQNYPNPFNPTTTISYDLPKTENVTLAIFNALGQKVATLVNARQAAGTHTAIWNGTNDAGMPLGSGIYLYQLRSGGHVETKKMILLK